MTLREMVDSIGIDAEPLECAFCIAAFVRTVAQGEASTFEGECATLVAATEKIGRVDEPDNVRKLLEMFSNVADMEVPDSFWVDMATSHDDSDYDA